VAKGATAHGKIIYQAVKRKEKMTLMTALTPIAMKTTYQAAKRKKKMTI
jgi:hypothetical protein